MKNRYKKTIVICSLALVVLLYSIATRDLPTHDEWILNKIGRLSLGDLFRTIRYEPHPPLFYLLLHFLPSKILYARFVLIIITLLFYCIVFTRQRYIKTINKLGIGSGFLLFFLSTTGLSISFTLKQDILSFPLITLLLLHTLYLYLFSKNIKAKDILLLTTLTLVLLFTSYINFLWSITLWLLLLKKFTLNKKLVITLIVIGLSAAGYYSLFGFNQIVSNIGRFEWVKMYPNTLSSFLANHVTGTINHMVSELGALIFAIMFALGINGKTLKKVRPVYFYFIATIAAALFVGYFGSFFVRNRYLAYPLLLSSFIVGAGIDSISRNFKSKQISTLLTILLVILGISGFSLQISGYRKLFQSISQYLEKAKDHNKDYYLISNNSGTLPFMIAEMNPLDKGITPYSLLDPTIDVDSTSKIEKLLSAVKIKDKDFNVEGKNFILIFANSQSGELPIIDKKLLKTLQTKCSITATEDYYQYNYYTFENCSSEK